MPSRAVVRQPSRVRNRTPTVVDVTCELRGVPRDTLTRWGHSLLRGMKQQGVELSVLITNDPTIHALNRDYRRKDKATDVLAFAQREGRGVPAGDGPVPLGDVVISLETARRQARVQGHGVRQEVLALLTHGVLHLLGYDHRTAAEEREMNAQAARLMRGIDVSV